MCESTAQYSPRHESLSRSTTAFLICCLQFPLFFLFHSIVLKSGKRAWCFLSLISSHSKTMDHCRVLCFVLCIFSFDEEYIFLLSVDYSFISILGLCWQFGVWNCFVKFLLIAVNISDFFSPWVHVLYQIVS